MPKTKRRKTKKPKCAKCGSTTGDIRGRLCGKCAFPNKRKKKR